MIGYVYFSQIYFSSLEARICINSHRLLKIDADRQPLGIYGILIKKIYTSDFLVIICKMQTFL